MWSCLPVDFTSGHTQASIFLVSRADIGAGDKITWQKEIHTRASVLTQAHELCRWFRRSVHFIGPEGRIHCAPCPWCPALLSWKKKKRQSLRGGGGTYDPWSEGSVQDCRAVVLNWWRNFLFLFFFNPLKKIIKKQVGDGHKAATKS